MEKAHARYFVALCEEKSFTKAAHRCGISQPSLTNAIRRLEAELGGALFKRGHFQTEMTTLGAEYAPFIEMMWSCSLAIERLAAARSMTSADERSGPNPIEEPCSQKGLIGSSQTQAISKRMR